MQLHTYLMATIQNNDNTKCWGACGATETSHTLLVGVQNSTATLENSVVIF